MQHSRVNRLTGYGVILAIGITMACLVTFKKSLDLEHAKKIYISASHAKSELAFKQLNDSLIQIYQNLRTLSFLPNIKKIDRHANNLGDDANTTIQQIYNNLKSNVDISEIYIVP